MIRRQRAVMASIVVSTILAGAAAVPVGASPLGEQAPTGRSLEVHDPPLAGALADLASTDADVESDTELAVERIAGRNRFETAVLISHSLYPDGSWPDGSPVDLVVVTNGLNFPDALAGGPYAAGLGPLLLVPPSGKVPQVVMDELARLDPAYIDILGSTDAVGADIEAQLAGTGAEIARIAGRDRYDTAAKLALATFDRRSGANADNAPIAIIASGETFADALGASAISAVGGHVLLLGSRRGLTPETWAALDAIQPRIVHILGSFDRLPHELQGDIASRLGAGLVGRIDGANRYQTAARLSNETVFPSWIVDHTRNFRSFADFPVLADGLGFPDALASTPLAWALSSPILLGQRTCLNSHTVGEVERLRPQALVVVGGTDRISDRALTPVICP